MLLVDAGNVTTHGGVMVMVDVDVVAQIEIGWSGSVGGGSWRQESNCLA